jgi:hypothetical protein
VENGIMPAGGIKAGVRLGRARRALLAAGCSLIAIAASGEDKPKGETKQETPAPAAPSALQMTVTRPDTRAVRRLALAAAGPRVDLKALSVTDGEARLVVGGAETVVHVGDALGRDQVKSITPGRIVLHRPAGADPKSGEALVVMDFDAAGRARVLVLSTKDPTAPNPLPEPPAR